MKFCRNIKTDLELVEKNKILATGYFLDDYHDFKCVMILGLPSLDIIETKVKMNRLPKGECETPFKRFIDLKGLKIERGFRQKVKRIVGGERGCIHLVDLIHEMAQSIIALLKKAQINPNGKEIKGFPTDIFYGECIGLSKADI